MFGSRVAVDVGVLLGVNVAVGKGVFVGVLVDVGGSVLVDVGGGVFVDVAGITTFVLVAVGGLFVAVGGIDVLVAGGTGVSVGVAVAGGTLGKKIAIPGYSAAPSFKQEALRIASCVVL